MRIFNLFRNPALKAPLFKSMYLFAVTMRSGELLIGLPVLNSRTRALLWWKVNGSNPTGCSHQKLSTVFSALLFC